MCLWTSVPLPRALEGPSTLKGLVHKELCGVGMGQNFLVSSKAFPPVSPGTWGGEQPLKTKGVPDD